ncbi:hypothetical protein P6F15_11780 [Thiopseudomonas alkaliphila]|uniref:hypothetical protein n=1 Tax=Thiopseudomonas alkaliphila TaxID=1697053 RepID=UPI0035715BF1
MAAVETHGLANDALPTTKQQLVTDIRKLIWPGKIKKPCIYKQITGLLRHSWTGKKTIRYFAPEYRTKNKTLLKSMPYTDIFL